MMDEFLFLQEADNICKKCVHREGGYTLQSRLILSSTLYSNIKSILDWKYFKIIMKENENLF